MFCALLICLAGAPAYACNLLNLEIADAPKATVGVFNAEGKFEREVPKADVIHKVISACNESLGLVQIKQADGSTLWLDPIELRIPSAPAAKTVCITRNSTKPSDSKQAVSSGAGPDGKCPSQ